MLLPAGHPVRGLCVALVLATLPSVALADDPVYDQSGAQYGRGFFAPFQWERIDTVTGNVFLSFTDLVLPGNAGMNLSIVRTYNSRDGRWRFGIGGAPLRFEYSAPNNNIDDVDFITPDSGRHNAAGAGSIVL